MRLKTIPWMLAATVTLGCGDDSVGSEGGGSSGTGAVATDSTSSTGSLPTSSGQDGTGSSGADSTGSSSGSTATGGTDSGTTDSGGTDSGSSSDSGETETGMGVLSGSISNLQMFQDCMPIVSPDPVNATFTLELTNRGDAPATGTVVSAAFVDAGGMAVAVFSVTPDVLGPLAAGDTAMAVVSKVPDSLDPANGCAVLTCNASYTVSIIVTDADGTELSLSDTATVDCVF